MDINIFRSDNMLGPGCYDPKDELITKNNKVVKIVSKNQSQQKSKKEEMEMFLNKVMKLGSINMPDGSNILGLSQQEKTIDDNDNSISEYNSISQITKPREDGVGSSCFMSKTKRGHSSSETPGPGSYNVDYNHQFSKNTRANFGSN